MCMIRLCALKPKHKYATLSSIAGVDPSDEVVLRDDPSRTPTYCNATTAEARSSHTPPRPPAADPRALRPWQVP